MEIRKIEMTDITAPEDVQIQIHEDGKVIWVNVNGICALRCCQIENLQVEDNRSFKVLSHKVLFDND